LYFNNQTLSGAAVLSRIDPTINFNWWWGSPSTKVSTNHFSARWAGSVLAPVTGVYKFTTRSDDGVRLWVNGHELVNNWTNHSATNNSGTISLVAGQKYSIKMEYYERTGTAVAQLSWTLPGKSKQIVPKADLFGK
jgi:hypothetical protein